MSRNHRAAAPGAHRLGWVLGLVVAALAACGRGPVVLPPIPPSSGPILLKPAPAPPVHDGETVVDRVVAVVNGDVILMSELQEAVLLTERESKNPPPSGADLEEVQRTVLNRMIDHRLQVQEAQREKIEVSDDELRAMVDDFVRRNGGDREKIEVQLQAQGITWEGLRRDMREQMLAQRVRGRRVSRRANVTEAEVDAYLAENRAKFEASLKYHARHIAILAQPSDSPAAWERARAEIEEIAAELKAKSDFATVARERSQDASAASGGDLGWLTRGELEPQFEDPLLKLPKGGVTAPIKSTAGYHIFLLEDREEMTPELLADARQQVRDLLAQRKAQERFDEWLEGLRKRALIAIRL